MLRRLFTHAASSGLVEVATRHPGDKWTSRYLPVAEFLAAEDEKVFDGQDDVFFGPGVRRTPSPLKESVQGASCAWLDYDGVLLPDMPITPTAVVFSGGGYHLYWATDRWMETPVLEEVNRALIKAVGGDSDVACWNANRYLRIPGTRTYKHPGVLVEVIHNEPLVWSPDDLLKAARLRQPITPKAKATTWEQITRPDARGYASRSELDFAVCRALLAQGVSRDGIKTIFDTQPIGEKYREHGDPKHYLLATLDKAATQAAQEVVGPAKKVTRSLVEDDDCYWMEGQKGRTQLSTFVFRPRRRLNVEGGEEVLVGDMLSRGDRTTNVVLPRSAFTSVSALTKHLPSTSWAWLGTDGDVRTLLPHLVEQEMASALGVKAAGRHGDVFVSPQVTIGETEVWTADKSPVVYLPAPIPAPTVLLPVPDDTPLAYLLQKVVDVNMPQVMWPILGWWLAASMKPVIEASGYRFPSLNLFGTRGSGKTTTITDVMMRLYAYDTRTPYDSGTTRFVLLSILGSTNALPVLLQEFRESLNIGMNSLARYIRELYDLGTDPRGRPDRTVETFPLTAPLVVDGEDMLGDPAIRERIIAVRMRQEYLVDKGPALQEAISAGLDQFMLPWIRWTLAVDMRTLLAQAEDRFNQAFPEALPHRVRRNYTVCYAGLIAAQAMGLPVPDPREALLESLSWVFDPRAGRTRLQIDDFVEQAVAAIDKGTVAFYWQYDREENVVWFHFSGAYAWWRQSCRRSGADSLGREALIAQLQETKYIVGEFVKGRYPCWGVSLEAAAYLDVPRKLAPEIGIGGV